MGLVALGFLALSLAVNAALLPRLADALPGNAGDPMLNAWILGWVSDAIVAHPWDLWDAPIFHPHVNTLAYSEHLLGIALFVAPVYWLTGNAVLTYNVAFLAGYAFAGVGMFVLVRRLTGRTDAALVAGVLFACSPYLTSSQIARVQMLTCGWSALALAALHRFVDSGERRALVGFVACWMLQTLSNMYLGVFLALPIGLVVAHALAVGRPRLALGRLLQIAAGGLVLALLLAPVLSSTTGCQDDMGFAHGRDTVRQYSADMRSYVSVWIDRRPLLLRPEISADRALYPGAAVVLLAAWGLWKAARRRLDGAVRSSAALYGGVALAAFALSLGPEPSAWGHPIGIASPYAALLDLVPGFDGFRAPARFALPVLMALAVLAGIGVTARSPRPAWRRALIGVALAVALWEARRPFPWVEPVPAEQPSTTAAYAWLAAQPAGPVLKLPITTHFQAQRPDAGASVTLRYQLAGLRHGKALINGSSGFVSPLVTLLQGAASPLNTLDTVDDALGIVRAIGGRYVVVHLHEYRDDARAHIAQVLDQMRADADQVESVRDFGSTLVLDAHGGAGGPAAGACRGARPRPLPGVGVAQPRSGAGPGRRRPGLALERSAARRHLARRPTAPRTSRGRREVEAAGLRHRRLPAPPARGRHRPGGRRRRAVRRGRGHGHGPDVGLRAGRTRLAHRLAPDRALAPAPGTARRRRRSSVVGVRAAGARRRGRQRRQR